MFTRRCGNHPVYHGTRRSAFPLFGGQEPPSFRDRRCEGKHSAVEPKRHDVVEPFSELVALDRAEGLFAYPCADLSDT